MSISLKPQSHQFPKLLSWMLFACILFTSCQTNSSKAENSNQEKLIAISKFYPNNDYQIWLSSHEQGLNYVEIYSLSNDSIDYYLSRCAGMVLTGGRDVDPVFYNKGEQRYRCGKLDARRDSLESIMVNYAFNSQKPLLGVCRGMQILNVSKGGSLIIDLPTDRNTNIHQQENGDSFHSVFLEENNNLHQWVEVDSLWVNSNHHQAIDRLAEGFEILALAQDSTIESIYWTDSLTHPYVFGVQWHPERMNQDDPASAPIGKSFLQAISNSYHQN